MTTNPREPARLAEAQRRTAQLLFEAKAVEDLIEYCGELQAYCEYMEEQYRMAQRANWKLQMRVEAFENAQDFGTPNDD